MAKKRLELAPRNDPLGLTQRAWRNLNLIEREYEERDEGHVVTQLVQTLLALIVFPKARGFPEHFSLIQMDKLEERGWPRPMQKIGKTETIGGLLKHMRNAVCHGLLKFYGDSKEGSDSRKLSEITIEFSDRKGDKAPIDWKVTMEGQDLKRFLWHIFDYLNDGSPGPLN
jgi:HEPN pEK499 p136